MQAYVFALNLLALELTASDFRWSQFCSALL